MDSDHVKIWVKVDDGTQGRATSVRVKSDADVDDLVIAVLKQEKLDIAPRYVTVEFQEVEIGDTDRLVTEFITGSKKPLVLKCPDEYKGM